MAPVRSNDGNYYWLAYIRRVEIALGDALLNYWLLCGFMYLVVSSYLLPVAYYGLRILLVCSRRQYGLLLRLTLS